MLADRPFRPDGAEVDVAAPARRPDADSKAGRARVPDRVLGGLRRQPGNRGIGEAHAPGHRSGPAGEDGCDALHRLAGGGVGKMHILEGGGGLAVPQQLPDGADRFALEHGDACIGMALIPISE